MYCLGKKLRFSLFGKSHGPCVGGILEGIPAGFRLDEAAVAAAMARRRPTSGIGTDRVEADRVEFVQGLRHSVTDGTPLLMIIRNQNVRDDGRYLTFAATPRPGHADLPALLKFPGFDIRGGGQFSGRLTAPIVAAGAVAAQLLAEDNIRIAAFCRSIGPVADPAPRTFAEAQGSAAFASRACNTELDREMQDCIKAARADGDSTGGVVECLIEGLPIGFGGIWFESLDAELAAAVFAIPACKGVEFGKGFAITEMRGSESNDDYRMQDGRIVTESNNMGGIVGGMADGAPVVFRAAFKPTPSIAKPQDTVNLQTAENAELQVKGRHDPCIAPRAAAVVEAVTALVIADQAARGF